MTDTEPKASPIRPYLVLVGLIAGLALGAIAKGESESLRDPALEIFGIVGNLWLNALKMTVIPLMVALLISAVAKSADIARTGRVARRSIFWIVLVCTGSAIFGALAIETLTALFPLPRVSGNALQAGLEAAVDASSPPQVAGAADFFKGVIPDNVVAAAANGDVLPLVIFSLLFALAASRIAGERRLQLVGLFEAIAETLLVVIGWVLWIAPIGVFALAFTVGAAAGGAAFAALGHYVLLVSLVGVLVTLAAYPFGIFAGSVRAGAFFNCMIAPQSVAVSTRSSLASLPAMLTAARGLHVREEVAGVTLPLAVALFRATGPAMNVAVAFYVAHWMGLEPTMTQIIAATAVGAVMSYGAISLPGEVSFFSSIGPIALALGSPLEPLALLVAVEMVPDIFRTLGNVTWDVSLAATVDRNTEDEV